MHDTKAVNKHGDFWTRCEIKFALNEGHNDDSQAGAFDDLDLTLIGRASTTAIGLIYTGKT